MILFYGENQILQVLLQRFRQALHYGGGRQTYRRPNVSAVEH
jgi:hypothetical protein